MHAGLGLLEGSTDAEIGLAGAERRRDDGHDRRHDGDDDRQDLPPRIGKWKVAVNSDVGAYSIKEVRELIAISNSSICKEIGVGRLRTVKCGNRTMILAADLQDWVSRWPASRSSGKSV
jgi:hypothetical protein